MDAWLNGRAFDDWDDRLPVVNKDQVLARQTSYTASAPTPDGMDLQPAPADFHEIEAPLTESEARRAAGRCIDCAICSECGECVSACPVDGCIDLRAHDEELEVKVGAVVVSTGFKLFAADLKPEYGYGLYKNVITGMQMDRLLAPTRPFNTILRPGDGKVPERIAYILCTGSRDETVGNPLCSRFCCMYSIKQNQLLMGALPLADVTVHYMDIRAPGKRYDEFYEQAKAMGATYVRAASPTSPRPTRETSSSPTRTSRTAAPSPRPSTTSSSSRWASSRTGTPNGCSTSASLRSTSGSGWRSRRRT